MLHHQQVFMRWFLKTSAQASSSGGVNLKKNWANKPIISSSESRFLMFWKSVNQIKIHFLHIQFIQNDKKI